MRPLFLTLTLIASLLAPPAPAVDSDIWMADMAPALERAVAEGKDVLVDFTGSDWCGWCIRLHDEVFQYDEFLAYAKQHFVLVALDFPKEGGKVWQAMPAALRARNQEQSEAFGITGFPSVLLMTADGVAYARTGYQKGGADAYVTHLESLRRSKARTERAAAAQLLAVVGDDDAQQELEAAYGLLGEIVAERQAELLALIVRLDPEDSRLVLAGADVQTFLREHLSTKRPDFDAAARALEAMLVARPSLSRLASFHYYRGMVAAQRGDAVLARASMSAMDRLEGVSKQARKALADAVAGIEEDEG